VPFHRHSWLFEPAAWTAAGRFWQDGEIEREARGSSIVRHAPGAWEIEGTIELLGEPPATFRNVYELAVPAAGARSVAWRSHNPAVGSLAGIFFIADDTIMSSFRSRDGGFAGSEHMCQLAADRYQARGLFLASGKVLSAWSMELVRKG
jgi:hypothetical protein